MLSTYFLLLFIYLYYLFSSDSDNSAWVAGDIVHNLNISFTDDQLLPGNNNYNYNPPGPDRGKQFYTHNPRLILFIKYTIRSIVCEAFCHLVIWSLGHLVILSLGHSVTQQSPSYSVTQSLSHWVTWSQHPIFPSSDRSTGLLRRQQVTL